jgi:hypothetical protein
MRKCAACLNRMPQRRINRLNPYATRTTLTRTKTDLPRGKSMISFYVNDFQGFSIVCLQPSVRKLPRYGAAIVNDHVHHPHVNLTTERPQINRVIVLDLLYEETPTIVLDHTTIIVRLSRLNHTTTRFTEILVPRASHQEQPHRYPVNTPPVLVNPTMLLPITTIILSTTTPTSWTTTIIVCHE